MTDWKLREWLKQSAITALSVAKAYPVVATSTSDVLSLIRRLHPRDPGPGLLRMGPRGDGGYLVPDDIDGIVACFSPGVGAVFGFEQECVARGMRVFMADGSVDAPVVGHSGFSFIRKFVGAVNSTDHITMDDWVGSSSAPPDGDLLLQIDIEGSEYETFLNISDGLMRRFRIIAGEFHNLDQLWNRPYFALVSSVFAKILQTHTCVHIHPNNCARPVIRHGVSIPPLMEFTFLRNDRVRDNGFAVEFPHLLDFDNADRQHFALPDCWFQSARISQLDHGEGPLG